MSPFIPYVRALERSLCVLLLFLVAIDRPARAVPQAIDLSNDPDAVRINAVDIGDLTGERIAACDVNGDGVKDLVISAEEADGVAASRSNAGEVYVLFGRRGAWMGQVDLATDTDIRIVGQQIFDHMGSGLTCGDVNDDAYDDPILGAFNTDSISDSRTQAGQIHVVFGGPSLPSFIDLAMDPGTVLYGAVPGGTLGCCSPAVGDVNGDGVLDVLGDAVGATNLVGTIGDAGRIHVLFGRRSWPASIDLLTGSDVTIYGSEAEALSQTMIAEDLDGDAIDEIVATARLGDGPLDTRPNAGDIHVFLGRTTWPPVIDLAVTTSDTVIYGVDDGDQAGNSGGLAFGDFEGDGLPELVAGANLADGRTNSASLTGEARLFEAGAALPPVVDLRTDTDSVVYGADIGDRFARTVQAADVNHDGLADLVCSASDGDGPDELRTNAGEIAIFYGRDPFPIDLDVALGDEDVIIYAPLAGDKLRVPSMADLNGDGVPEVVAATEELLATRVRSMWLISPVDTDGDGVTNLPDNCPLVANPGQADADLDLVGDACQGDWDGDGQADAEDCAPADPLVQAPAQVTGLVLSGQPVTTLTWQPAALATEYDVTRGALADLDGSNYGACQNARDPDRTDTTFVEDQVPAPGEGFFLLVRGRNPDCAGTYGTTSGGQPRDNANPAACP